MKALFTIWFLFIILPGAYGQDPVGEPALSMAAYSPGFADPFSPHANPSVLAGMKRKAAGIYTEQKFLIKEWQTAVAAIVFPTAQGNFSCYLHYSGTDNFSGFRSGFSYARSFGSSFDLGVQFLYYKAGIPGYSSISGTGYTVSGLFHLSSKFHTGINLSNTGEEEGGKANKKLPGKFSLGLGYELSKLVFITTEISKTKQSPVNIRSGIHYGFHEKIFFRTGFESATQSWFLATGLKWKQLVVQLIASLHPILGSTPGLQLMIEEKEK